MAFWQTGYRALVRQVTLFISKEIWKEMTKRSVHTTHFLDPIIFLASFQLIEKEMLISVTNLFEFE